MAQPKFQKCRRGLFGLSSWDPPRQPRGNEKQTQNHPPTETQGIPLPAKEPVLNASKFKKKEKQLIAKYTYKSNTTSPLGKELDMKQGERFTLKSDTNQHWWLAENADGQQGYIPASYMMAYEIEGLPWLKNKQIEVEEELEEEKPMLTTFGPGPEKPKTGVSQAKAYVSAYSRNENGAVKEDAKRWFCEVCDKSLNGPKPYSAHMNSKAHKEEVEYAKETGRI